MEVNNTSEELLNVADEIQQEYFWSRVLDDGKYPRVLEEEKERLPRDLEQENKDMEVIDLNDYVKSNCGVTGNRRTYAPASEHKEADDELAKWLQYPLELEMLDSGYSQASSTMLQVNKVLKVSDDTMDKKASLGARKYTLDDEINETRISSKPVFHFSKEESSGVDRFSHSNSNEGENRRKKYGELVPEGDLTGFSSNKTSTVAVKEVDGSDVQASLPSPFLTHIALSGEETWLSEQGLLPCSKVSDSSIDMLALCKNSVDKTHISLDPVPQSESGPSSYLKNSVDKTHISLGLNSPSGSAPFSYLLCSEQIENSLNFYDKPDVSTMSKDMPLKSSMTDFMGCANADFLSLSDHQSANAIEHVQLSHGERGPQPLSGWTKGCQNSELMCLNDHQDLANYKHVVDYVQSSDGRSFAEDLLNPITPTKSRKDDVTSTKDDGASSGGSDTSDSFKETFSSNKRKKEQLEWQNEDVEAESAVNSQTRNSASKRTRTNEVHNLSERRRRTRINDKMNALRELIPNASKSNKAALLDETIEYLKTLQLQLQVMAIRAGVSFAPMMPSTSVLPSPPQPIAVGMSEGLISGVVPDPGIAVCDMSYAVPVRHLVPSLTELSSEVRSLQFVNNNYVAQQQQLQIYQQQLIKQHHNQQQQVLQQLIPQTTHPLNRQL